MATITRTADQERPWLEHYPSYVPHQLDYPEAPVWHLLKRAADNHPERTACCYYDQSLTYAELYTAARQMASSLQKIGVAPGDRVGILLPNVPEFLIAIYGAWMAGAVGVPISPLMVEEEACELVKAIDCKVVVTLDLLAPLVKGSGSPVENIIDVSIQDRLSTWQQWGYMFARWGRLGFSSKSNGQPHTGFKEFLERGDPNFEPLKVPTDSLAYILATGGTTDHPKAVMLSHANLMANAWQVYHWSAAKEGTATILAVLPFFHSYGLSTCATGGVAMAATLVLHHRFQPKKVIQLMERYEPQLFPAVPMMLNKLNEILRDRPLKTRSLLYCISGGSALDLLTGEEFARHSGAKVVEGYGLSEASPITHVGPLEGDARPGIGLPFPDTDARVVDAETGTKTMPPGEVGELIVRGPQVMLGYWNDPEATAETIRDGWLFTGDLATCDEDGFFRIVNRKKDLIITGGLNVYPADVEPVLREFPGVADVVVVGEPDQQRGELVKAVISMEKGHQFNHKEFAKYCRKHLSKYKRPKLVEVVNEDLPRNFLGKVLRRKLREGEYRRQDELVAAAHELTGKRRKRTERRALAVVAGARTPFVKSFGETANVSAVDLGRTVTEAVFDRAGVEPTDIDEVIFGNIGSPADASNIARVIALVSGVPQDRIAHTVNRNCASGMESVVEAWQAIEEGRAGVVVAGGTESMSNVPLLWDPRMMDLLVALKKARTWWQKIKVLCRFRPGFLKPQAALQMGLTDPVCGLNMGETAEVLAREFEITREEQDRFALRSHELAIEAWQSGFFDDEVIPINAEGKQGRIITRDSGPRGGQSMKKLGKLKPVFQKNGTVTVGNSCPITDGAAAMAVTDAELAEDMECEPLGYITAYAAAGCDPRRMGLGPVFAIHKLLEDTGLELDDFDLVEINEAFAAQVLACLKAMESEKFARDELGRDEPLGKIDLDKLNIHGGAIALGHPVGTTGARLIITLLRSLRAKGLRRGLASLCVGGGQGFAVMVETELEE